MPYPLATGASFLSAVSIICGFPNAGSGWSRRATAKHCR